MNRRRAWVGWVLLAGLSCLPCAGCAKSGKNTSPGPNSSTVSASPTTGVIADGVQRVVIQITVRNADGATMPGQQVSIAATGSANTIQQPGPTDQSGVTTATLGSTIAEIKTITVTVNPGSNQVVLAQQPTVEFIGDEVRISPALSTATAAPAAGVIADGATASTVTVTLRDINGNVVAGQPVQLSSTGTLNTLTQPGSTNAGGVTTGTLASTRAETKTVTVTARPGPGQVVLLQQPAIAFVGDPGNLSAGLSSATASPTTNVVADGATTSTVTVTVRDANGNSVAGQAVQLSSTGTMNTLVQPGVTNASGVTTGTIASTVAETKTVTATVNPGPSQVVVTQQPTVGFIGDANNISAALSTVAANPTAGLLADGAVTSTVTITVLDANSNPVPGQAVTLSSTGANNTFAQPGSTNASGVTTGTLATTRAETKTVTATVSPGPGQTVLNQTPTVGFVWPFAATYYVRQTGSDGAAGTSPNTAWRTLGHAAANVVAGDTVYVGAGTYVEQVTVTTSGTLANPIRFVADSDGARTGDAGEVIVDAAGANEVFYLDDTSYVEVRGFTLRGSTNLSTANGGVRISGADNTVCDNRIYGNAVGVYVHGETAWWDTSYGFRHKIVFGTGHSLLPTGYTAAFAMDTRVASTNVALASGDDIRIVWQPTAGVPVELDRIGDTFDNASTTLEFRLQTDVGTNLNEAATGSYYVYFGHAGAGTPPTDEMQVYYFADFFNRANSTTIGNGWTEWTDGGDAEILGNALVVKPTADADPPQVGIAQSFALGAIPEDFTITFDWDVPSNGESVWSFWGVNVGTAASMVNSNRTTGVGPGLYNGESLGLTGTETIDNDMSGALENNINGPHSYRLVIDKSAFTYDYYRGGILRSAAVTFVNNQAVLDRYRIGADNFGFAPGEEWSIDNVKIVLNVADVPEEALDPEEAQPTRNGRRNTIERNSISNQTGLGDGIVIRNASDCTVRNNVIYNNARHGISIIERSQNASIVANTLYANTGSQIRADGIGNTATASDNVIANGTASGIEVLAGTTSLTSDYNDVFSNGGGNWTGLAQGGNDISLDPRFVDPDGADNVLGGANGADDQLHLDPGFPSPCLDAGSATALATPLADGSPFADLTSRTDGVLDGTAPDGSTLNQGYHYAALTGAPAALAQDDARLLYGEASVRQPRLRTWDESGGTWSAEGSAAPASSTIVWTVHALSPALDQEELTAVLADSGSGTELDLLRWDGFGWRHDWTSTAITSANASQRGFDLVYEANSGNAVAVYSNNTPNPVFRVRNQGAWTAEAAVFATPPGSGIVLWVELAARPGSDEIALVYADANSELHAVVWDGTTWDEAGTETTLSATLSTATQSQAFAAAYEATSGDLLVLWGHQYVTEDVQYATKAAGSTTWNTSTLAAAGARAKVVGLATEAGTDRVAAVLTEGQGDSDTVGMVWNGTAWTDITEIDGSSATDDTHAAIAWTGVSGTAVLVYKDNDGGAGLDWARWTSGSGWAVQADAAVAGMADFVAMHAEAFTAQNTVLAAFADASSNLFAATCDGTSWTVTNGGAALETTLSGTATLPFTLRVRGP